MKPINILLTCSSFHAVGIIDCLKNNPDNVPVKVIVTNCNVADLPPSEYCDYMYVVPRINEEDYIPRLLEICNVHSVDVIFPTSSRELEVMARNHYIFASRGIKVAVSSLEAVLIAGDKVKTWEKFSDVMPFQVVADNASDVLDFSRRVKNICCKATNLCGGQGFAVVDDKKCTDVSYFHACGKKHYINLWQLCHAVEESFVPMILQEYHPGMDFSILAMAVNGKMTHCCGCYGTKLEFGAIIEGEIGMSPYAKEIAELVIKELGIDGIVGFDFILCPYGRALLIDINLRVTASAQFYAKAGVNIPWLQVLHLLGEDISNIKCEIDYGLVMSKYFAARYYKL
jgi:carbamoyl-phosphate synthase large subunit